MVLGPTNAYANPCDTETFDLPSHVPYVDEVGVKKGIIFNIEGTKSLLSKLDCGEFHLRMRTVEKEQLETKTLQVDLLEATVTLLEERQKIIEGEKTRIYEKWKADNKRMHEAESKVSYSWIGWTVAAVLATTTVSFGAAFMLK